MAEQSERLRELAEIAARFDGRAPEYDRSSMHRGLAAAVAGFVRLSDIEAMLDVATGTGLVLRSLPVEGTRRLVGVDVSEVMLAVARSALPAAQFVRADAQALPFPTATFDLVTCVTALHLFADPIAALLEWRRVLRESGRVVVAVFRADATGARPAPGAHGPLTARHFAFGTLDALADFARAGGMRLSRHITWTHPEPHDECLIAEFVVDAPGRNREHDA